jgi:hypothetical protein
MTPPVFFVREIRLYERPLRLRMPFRFGVVTLTEAPQCFVRARIETADGRSWWGAAAEVLAPKWFDKDPALSNEENFDQLRRSLRLAAESYTQAEETRSAFEHFALNYDLQISQGSSVGLNALIACFGPALIDRAILDALCRSAGVSFYQAVQSNLAGIDARLLPQLDDLAGFDMPRFLAGLRPADSVAARHTVGLIDAIGGHPEQVNDGLPESLEEVVATYGNTYFKLKVGGNIAADVERLSEIAAVLDCMSEPYLVSLDGNEQYDSQGDLLELWRRMLEAPRLARLRESILFIEQPVGRAHAFDTSVAEVSRIKPVIIDESDDGLAVFPRARALGFRGVSSKSCKGFYKSLLNAARCGMWNAETGERRYFMTGEDLTVQAGLAVQQDLALVNVLGLTHVERNGHHYANGMAGSPASEQDAFLAAHPDLYEKQDGTVRLKIRGGRIALGTLDRPGFATGAYPEWTAMQPMTAASEDRRVLATARSGS